MKAYSTFQKGDILYVTDTIDNTTGVLEPNTYIVIKQYPSRRIELLALNTEITSTIAMVLTEEDMANKIIKEGNVVPALKEMADKAISQCFMYLLTNPDENAIPFDFGYFSSYAQTSCMTYINERERLVAGNLCENIFSHIITENGIELPTFTEMKMRFNTLKAALL